MQKQTAVLLQSALVERVERAADLYGQTAPELIEEILDTYLRVAERESSEEQVEGATCRNMRVEDLLWWLNAPDPEQARQAKQELRARGPEVFDDLENALQHPQAKVVLAVAEVLASSGASRTMGPLLTAFSRAQGTLRLALLQELRVLLRRYPFLPEAAWEAVRLCTPTTAPLVARQLKETQNLVIGPQDTLRSQQALSPEDVVSLVALLRWKRTGGTAQRIAYVLTTMAVTAPVPELRQALPFLRPAWHNFLAPAEFLQAVQAIEAATNHWAELPLPAESAQKIEEPDLPVPSVGPELH